MALASLRAEADRGRQKLVKEELARYIDRELVFSATQLGEADRRLLAKLLEAADVVEQLNLLQANPEMLAYQQEVERDGTEDDKRLFQRNHGPWCLESPDVRCNALRSTPAREIGQHAWPKGFGAADLPQLGKLPSARALLSPFTHVRKQGGVFLAVPLVKDEVLGPKIRQLSELLKQAAELTEEPSLKSFLSARAKALLSDAPYPFDASDLEWIALKSRWEVTVGPYEAYRNPLQVKARFAMYIGLEDTAATAALSAYAQDLQLMENLLSRMVGRAIYPPRRINRRTAIRAVQLIRAAGDGRNSQGAVIAYHLPNVGQGPEQGLTKKVILINHLRATHPLAVQRANISLDGQQAGLVTEEAAVQHITFHEFCHGFGAYPGMQIKVGKQETTVGAALGEHNLALEELKAEVFSLWLVDQLRRRRKLTAEEQEQRYATSVVRTAGLLQMKSVGAHTQAAAVLLGTLLKDGAVTYDGTTGRFTIDFRRFRRSLPALAKRVATIQFEGNKNAATALIGEFVTRHGKTATLADNLALIKARHGAAFADAGIKPVTFSYKVADLVVPPKPAAPPKPAPAAPPKPAPAAKPAAPAKAAPAEKKQPEKKQPEKKKAPEKAQPAAKKAPEKKQPAAK